MLGVRQVDGLQHVRVDRDGGHAIRQDGVRGRPDGVGAVGEQPHVR